MTKIAPSKKPKVPESEKSKSNPKPEVSSNLDKSKSKPIFAEEKKISDFGSQNLDMQGFSMEVTSETRGKLILEPKKGDLLVNHDWVGQQDPFVKFTYNKIIKKTKTHQGGGLKPVWTDIIEFDIDTVNQPNLACQVLDEDTTGSDLIGNVEIPILTLIKNKQGSQTFQVISAKKKSEGTIEIAYRFIGVQEFVKIDQISNVQHEPTPTIKNPEISDPNHANPKNSAKDDYLLVNIKESTGTLTLEPLEARLTTDHDSIGKQDPYVIFTYLDISQKTKVASGMGLNPTWTDLLEVRVDLNRGKLVQVVMKDDDVMSDDLIGNFSLNVEELAQKVSGTEWFQVLKPDGKTNEGKIKVRYSWAADHRDIKVKESSLSQQQSNFLHSGLEPHKEEKLIATQKKSVVHPPIPEMPAERVFSIRSDEELEDMQHPDPLPPKPTGSKFSALFGDEDPNAHRIPMGKDSRISGRSRGSGIKVTYTVAGDHTHCKTRIKELEIENVVSKNQIADIREEDYERVAALNRALADLKHENTNLAEKEYLANQNFYALMKKNEGEQIKGVTANYENQLNLKYEQNEELSKSKNA